MTRATLGERNYPCFETATAGTRAEPQVSRRQESHPGCPDH